MIYRRALGGGVKEIKTKKVEVPKYNSIWLLIKDTHGPFCERRNYKSKHQITKGGSSECF